MMRVAFVIPGLNRLAGAEQQVLALACGLAQRGLQVSVVTLSGDGELVRAALLAADVDFFSLGMRKGLLDPRGWLRWWRWVRIHKPQIVHAHLHHAILLVRASRLTAPVRVVVDTIHTSDPAARLRGLGFRASSFLSDCTTLVSPSTANVWLANRLVSPRKSLILPNGIDTQFWKPDPEARPRLRSELGFGDAFVWLAAGRLEEVKNHAALLDAMALLPVFARLVIAGSGSLESALRERVRALALESRVRFIGFTQNLLPWMHAADGAVLASHWEGLPLALLEAAACGLPAVATNVPGSRDAVESGKTGLLCAPGDPADLAAAMQHVMRLSDADRSAISLRARASAEARFSLAAVLDRWEVLYESLLATRTTPAPWARRSLATPEAPAAGACAESPLSPQPIPAGALGAEHIPRPRVPTR